MSSLRESNIFETLFKVPIWHLKNFRPFFTNNAFKVASCDLKAKQTFETMLTMLFCSTYSSFSFIFDNPCHIAAAFCASAAQHQRTGLDLAGQVADGRLFSAMNTPDVIQNFELNITGYGFPVFFRLNTLGRPLNYVRGRETVIYQPERRLSYQLPFWISRLGAGSCGNTRAELAPTRYRGGSCRTGRTQPGVLAKTAGRSIKRTVQLRKCRPDGYSWESPVEG